MLVPAWGHFDNESNIFPDPLGPTLPSDSIAAFALPSNNSFDSIAYPTVGHVAPQGTSGSATGATRNEEPSVKEQQGQYTIGPRSRKTSASSNESEHEQRHRRPGKPSFVWTRSTRRQLLELYLKTTIPMKDIHTFIAKPGFAPWSVCHKELKRLLRTDKPDALRLKHDKLATQKMQDEVIQLLLEQEGDIDKASHIHATEPKVSFDSSKVPPAKASSTTRLNRCEPTSPAQILYPPWLQPVPCIALDKLRNPREEAPVLETEQVEEEGDNALPNHRNPAGRVQSIHLPATLQQPKPLSPPHLLPATLTSETALNVRNGAERATNGFTASETEVLRSPLSDISLYNDDIAYSGYKGIHIAAKCQDIRSLKSLLDNGADINDRTLQGNTALHLAAENGCFRVCDFLLKRKVDFDALSGDGMTALHIAIKANKVLICGQLLDSRADVDLQTKDGLTALHIAARTGNEWVCNALLERAADINAKTKEGLTALHIAAATGNREICLLLLANGASAGSRTGKGESIREYATKVSQGYDLSDHGRLFSRVSQCLDTIDKHTMEGDTGNKLMRGLKRSRHQIDWGT